MFSYNHEHFRSLRLSALRGFLAALIDGRAFNYCDLSPTGLLHRIAVNNYKLLTYNEDLRFFVQEGDRLIEHPFSSQFLTLCQDIGEMIDPESPEAANPYTLAESIVATMGLSIKLRGDGYVFICGGRTCLRVLSSDVVSIYI